MTPLCARSGSCSTGWVEHSYTVVELTSGPLHAVSDSWVGQRHWLPVACRMGGCRHHHIGYKSGKQWTVLFAPQSAGYVAVCSGNL